MARTSRPPPTQEGPAAPAGATGSFQLGKRWSRRATAAAGRGAFDEIEPLPAGTPRTLVACLDAAAEPLGTATSEDEDDPFYFAPAEAERGVTVIALDESEARRSYRELRDASVRLAAGLAGLGVGPGDRVVIVLPTGHEFVVAFFAALRLGAIAVPIYPPALMEKIDVYLERLRAIRAHASADVVVASRSLLPLLGELALGKGAARRLVAVEELVSLDEAEPARASSSSGALAAASVSSSGKVASPPAGRARASAAVAGNDPGALAFLQYTSGSTGVPKGVALSHANLVANVEAIGTALRIRPRDVVVSWLPLYHDMGLIGALLTAVIWRLDLVLLAPTTFLARPVTWLRAITRHHGTLSPAPNFAYALCTKRVRSEDAGGLDLSSWRVALNGAEPVNLRTVVDFARKFKDAGFDPSAVFPVYGLAEASLAVTFPRIGEQVVWDVVDRDALARGEARPSGGPGGFTLMGCGRPVPGHQVSVRSATGGEAAPRQVGRVRVRGPSVMRGYYGDPGATAEALVDGWLDTGDLGYVADGQLFIAGRAKDLILLRGKNYYPEDLERAAERVQDVRAGSAVAFAVYDERAASDRVVLVCEAALDDDAAREELVARIRDSLGTHAGLVPDEVVLLPPRSIPKTSSGKRQRARTRELYLEGGLERRRVGRSGLAWVFVRSGVGLLVARAREVLSR